VRWRPLVASLGSGRSFTGLLWRTIAFKAFLAAHVQILFQDEGIVAFAFEAAVSSQRHCSGRAIPREGVRRRRS